MPTSDRFPIFDGHNDTLQEVCGEGGIGGRSFFTRSDEGHLDLPRAQEGGLGGGLTALFAKGEEVVLGQPGDRNAEVDSKQHSPATTAAPAIEHAQEVFKVQLAALSRIEADSQGTVKVARTASEVGTCLRQGVFAAVIHFEGAEAIDPKLEALFGYYEAGLRSLGIVWSRPNAFGHGVPFDFPSSPDTGPGLTDAGRALVRACNQLRIMVDVSHLNEKGFWDVEALTDAPMVATHSAVHALCPSARNLTDAQLDAIGRTGGVVGVNFHVAFLHPEGSEDEEATSIAAIVRHVDYIAERVGIAHVAFGSDFDGATMPKELGDASGLPKLLAAIRARGYGDAELRRITHENWLRVLNLTLN
jgi:membrane dipeptidase